MNNSILYFNSIKVQLEPNVQNQLGSYILFQFHKGTIRTVVNLIKLSTVIYFNSIKVQLEPYLSWEKIFFLNISIP